MFHLESFFGLRAEFRGSVRLGTMLTPILFAAGCVTSTDVRVQETAILKRYEENSPSLKCATTASTDAYNNRVCFAADLARAYISLADKASQSEELAAYGTIAAAGTAAGALAYGSNLNLVKGAGLAAGSIAVSNNYTRPGETAGYLLDAADGLLCIAKVGRTEGARSVPDAAEMIDTATDTIRIDLRKKLTRQAPDYRTIVTLIQSTTTPSAQKAILAGALKDPSEFKANLDACILKAMKGVT